MTDRPVCVVIAAHNAEQTIGDAVRTSLGQPQVGEVIVVDDASSDQTGAAARAAAEGDARLVLLSQSRNLGPSASRNLAVSSSTLPLISVLDADDYLLPGRFSRLLAEPRWDMIADNIHFVSDDQRGLVTERDVPQADPGTEVIDLPAFVRGNLGKRNVRRGELGFLKPVMTRAFLSRHRLAYDPALWLGEDFDIYIRMLAKGARFVVSREIGYIARVRNNSLSGQHKTKDLFALLQATGKTLTAVASHGSTDPVLTAYLDQLRHRYVLREFLDQKAVGGVGAAVRFAVSPPENLLPIARGVLTDKLRALLGRKEPSPVGASLLPTESGVPIA